MTRREKILAATVALLVLATGLIYGTKKIAAVFVSRADKIHELQLEVDGKQVIRHRGVLARKLLDQYANRSLPGDKELANSRYRAWLHEWCQGADILRADVKYVSQQRIMLGQEHVHDKHTFAVNLEADLTQLVGLLHDFHAEDYLHRIRSMKATASEDGQLQIGFLIEAMAVPGVPDRQLSDMPSQRLAFDDVEQYKRVILRRNPFSPPNQPPQFASPKLQQGYVNQQLSFSPDVTDPENGQLTYRVEHDGLEGLKIDENAGRIEWIPRETGEFEILVIAIDDGLPAKEASQPIHLSITEPPPTTNDADLGSEPTFDEAAYTFVTAIVETGGRRQVWLTIRTTGKLLKLFEGDTFKVGSMQGTIRHIHERHIEILSDEVTYLVRFGKSLHDGKEAARTEKEDVAASNN